MSLFRPFVMVLAEFDLAIDYGQIFVFGPSVVRPVVVWTDEHVAQGFAWSPSAVSFGVPDHDGESLVKVNTAPIASTYVGTGQLFEAKMSTRHYSDY